MNKGGCVIFINFVHFSGRYQNVEVRHENKNSEWFTTGDPVQDYNAAFEYAQKNCGVFLISISVDDFLENRNDIVVDGGYFKYVEKE